MKNTKFITCAALVGALLYSSTALAEGANHMKDINIEQSYIYTVSPGEPSMESTTASGLKVSIWVDQKDITYAPGEQIAIFAKANQDAYLTIIDVGTSGKVVQIFPNQYHPDNFIKKDEVVRIPELTDGFNYQISGPNGTELIKAIVSTNPGSIYGDAAKSFQAYGPFSQSNLPAKALQKDLIVTLNSTHENQWAHYNKVIYIRGSNTAAPVSATGAQAEALRAEVALGLTKAQIQAIQKTLKSKGLYSGSIDGIIGQKTRAAIRRWQENAGFNASGYIDQATFDRLI